MSVLEVEQDARVPSTLYNLDQFAGFLTYAPAKTLAPAPPAACPSTVCNEDTAFYYASMLGAIPKPDSYKGALDVGMALHTLGWGQPALELWQDWYEGSPEQQSSSGLTRDQVAEKWDTFSAQKPGGITMGSLNHWAGQLGWSPPGPRPAAVMDEALPPYTPLPEAETDAWMEHYKLVTKGEWIKTKSGAIAPRQYQNVRRAIVSLGIRGRLNTFTNRNQVVLPWRGVSWVPLKDEIDHLVRNKICDAYAFDGGLTHVTHGLVEICRLGECNPILEWLDAITWDGRPRLDKWLHTYLKAEDTVVNEAFGSVFLCAAVRRAKQPGCKFDHMLILEGEENAGKSRTVEILAGTEYFSDQSILHTRDKEQQEALEGIWFYEVAELAGIHRAQSDLLKAFITRQSDRNRKAYGRHREEDPRCCVFIATTNEIEQEYLNESAGLRRFWPVKVGLVDQDALERDRDQLFAEAVIRERQIEYLSLPREVIEAVREVQTNRQAPPPLIDALMSVTGQRTLLLPGKYQERVTNQYILDAVLRLSAKDQTPAMHKNVLTAMLYLGWSRTAKPFWINGKTYRGYERVSETCETEDDGMSIEAYNPGVIENEVRTVRL